MNTLMRSFALTSCLMATAAVHADQHEAQGAVGPTLVEAAAAGDLQALAAFREGGTSLDRLDPVSGATALASAIASGQTAAVDWLLENGADVNGRTGDNNTPLQVAAFVGDAETAHKLLARDADVTARNENGQTVWDTARIDWQTTSYLASLLQLDLDREAVEAGRAAILETLEPYLAEIAMQDVWIAVVIGDMEAVRTHLEGGVDVNKRNPDAGTTLLSVAAIYGHGELAAMLLEAGADVNGRNYTNGSTALHAAAFLGRSDITKLLLDKGADPGAITDDGATALAAAELDWPTTAYLAGALQVPVDQATMMSGKFEAARLLREHTATPAAP